MLSYCWVYTCSGSAVGQIFIRIFFKLVVVFNFIGPLYSCKNFQNTKNFIFLLLFFLSRTGYVWWFWNISFKVLRGIAYVKFSLKFYGLLINSQCLSENNIFKVLSCIIHSYNFKVKPVFDSWFNNVIATSTLLLIKLDSCNLNKFFYCNFYWLTEFILNVWF